MIKRPNLSSIVDSQLPRYVRDDYPAFVEFIKAYYEYLETQQTADPYQLRNIDETIDSFVQYFRKELAANAPQLVSNERFILSHIKELYLSKGTKASFDLLFKLLYGKDVTIKYPSTQILKASDGKWNLDVSLFIKIKWGTPDDIVGKTVEVITSEGTVLVFIDKYLPVSVITEDGIEQSSDTFEFFITKKDIPFAAVGNRVVYSNVFEGTIYPTTSGLKIVSGGKNFKPGEIYSLDTLTGTGSVLKVVTTDTTGVITKANVINFGTNYNSNFTTELTSVKDERDLSLGNISSIPSENVANISITIGSLAKYPGYYTSNDGFLDDAVFIHDGFYYQAFSYEVTIDEQLEKYKTILKNLIHPSGMALFGNYEIYNQIEIGAILEVAGDRKSVV